MLALDGKFYHFCEWLYKIILVNTLFLISSLPIVTIGSSMNAMLRVLRHQDAKTIGPYLCYFKEMLLKTLPLGVFNLFSLMFFLMIKNSVGLYHSMIIQLFFLIFSAFLLTYNINIYLLQIELNEMKNYFTLFRITFIFSLMTFYKVVWIPVIFGILYFITYPFLGVIINLIFLSAPLFYYQKIFIESLSNLREI
ncbi:hypothetical protein [Marinilactibacillus psychrotolerans]|uniref:Uncharacterized protein n=2 Tax=Marinilactibacillus TaxID=191769 RepID=A0A1I3YG23_9LACT|nr:hypothetical protein SAMN04488569_10224 [Marinilactibacillus piezotolerans]SJN27165.1 hypothetical protein FM115_03945 [Marinilactibacillus psychrotolerans 42ea]